MTGSLDIYVRPHILPGVVLGSGTAVVNGSSGTGSLTALDLPAAMFVTAGLVWTGYPPGGEETQQLQMTVANAVGSFAGIGGSGSFGGAMPLAGVAKVCLFGPCSAAIANLEVPLSVVGQGGTVYQSSAAVGVTVVGAPWTTATISLGTLTAVGGVAPASAPDSISLVTPIVFYTNTTSLPFLTGYARLSLSGLAIPEPGTAVLLGLATAALAALGRRRARR